MEHWQIKVSNMALTYADAVTSSSMKYITCFGLSKTKMAFTEEDKILIKVLRQEHGYGARRSVLQERVYRVRIRDIDHVRARLVEEWQLFDHAIIEIFSCVDSRPIIWDRL